MTPPILIHTWEVMARNERTGQLSRVVYPGTPLMLEFDSLVHAEEFIDRYWRSYRDCVPSGTVPVVVRHG